MSSGSNISAAVDAVASELRRSIAARGSIAIILDGMLPRGFFAGLASQSGIDWTQVIVLLAGEFLGVDGEAPASLRQRVTALLVKRVPIVEFYAPRGEAANLRAAAANYARLIESKKPDLAVIGEQLADGSLAMAESDSLAMTESEEMVSILEIEGRKLIGTTVAALDRVPLLIRVENVENNVEK